MIRRFCLQFFLLGFALYGCRVFPAANDTRPNFLLIITDDQRFDTMQYMPNTQSGIFDQGVVFTHGYITTPFCCPSRASMLTGLFAHNHQVHVNEDKLYLDTIVNDLHSNGYYTGLVGKYLNSWKGEARPEFDYWVSFFGGTVPNYYDPNLNINGKWEKQTGYITYLFRDHVIEFLERAAGQNEPFLLIFAPNAPHAPFTPLKEDKGLYTDLPPHRPPNFNEAEISDKPASIANRPLLTEEESLQIENIRRRQIQTLVSLDRAIGDIMGKLQETGELDQTLVFYISDNGKHWGEHRMDSKSTAYEESVRVPFALRHPGLVPVPYLEERLVANIDIPPTIYELSQTTVPWPMDGISLIPLLQNQADWRTHLLLEAWPDRGHWTAIHTGQFVYIETEGDRSELYDLKRDPYELENLIDEPEHTALIQELKEYMELEQVPRTGLP